MARIRHSAAALAFGCFARRPLLLIYQMGKVGSQTVEATLREAGLPYQICRVHILSPSHQKIFTDWLGDPGVPESTKASLRQQLAEARAIHQAITLMKGWPFVRSRRRKLKVIVGVREPVSLLLASIFQNHSDYFGSLTEITVEACRSLLLTTSNVEEARRRQMRDTFSYIHNWFDVELGGVLGIDVYSQPFAHSTGYAVYENQLARVLVYRYEDFARVKGMLESFLGTKLGGLVNRNIGADKDYGELYSTVRQKLRLPGEFLAGQCDSKLARHFYSSKEREQLRRYWLECPA